MLYLKAIGLEGNLGNQFRPSGNLLTLCELEAMAIVELSWIYPLNIGGSFRFVVSMFTGVSLFRFHGFAFKGSTHHGDIPGVIHGDILEELQPNSY